MRWYIMILIIDCRSGLTRTSRRPAISSIILYQSIQKSVQYTNKSTRIKVRAIITIDNYIYSIEEKEIEKSCKKLEISQKLKTCNKEVRKFKTAKKTNYSKWIIRIC